MILQATVRPYFPYFQVEVAADVVLFKPAVGSRLCAAPTTCHVHTTAPASRANLLTSHRTSTFFYNATTQHCVPLCPAVIPISTDLLSFATYPACSGLSVQWHSACRRDSRHHRRRLHRAAGPRAVQRGPVSGGTACPLALPIDGGVLGEQQGPTTPRSWHRGQLCCHPVSILKPDNPDPESEPYKTIPDVQPRQVWLSQWLHMAACQRALWKMCYTG